MLFRQQHPEFDSHQSSAVLTRMISGIQVL